MAISNSLHEEIKKSRWVSDLFNINKGDTEICNLGIGNPCHSPPDRFKDELETILNSDIQNKYGYTHNSGNLSTRKFLSDEYYKEYNKAVSENCFVLTSGASAGLNIVLRGLLNPGDNVIVPIPCFMEYSYYIKNHSGIPEFAKMNPDFTLNVDEIERRINQKTVGVLINSPNNPTGQVYSEESLIELSNMLERKSIEFGRIIYLICDETYKHILYDNVKWNSYFSFYKNTIIVHSYSKELSIPGERIGWVAVNPQADCSEELIESFTFCNRILGFLNAPTLMQHVIPKLQGVLVDLSLYTQNRDVLCNYLDHLGYEFVKPKGAFFIFVKSLLHDDYEFCKTLKKAGVIAIPGRIFNYPGYFRIAYCVESNVIEKALPKFKEVMSLFKNCKIQESI